MNTDIIKFIIIDDHPIFRTGLKQLIDQESGFSVAAEAGDSMDAFNQFELHKPDFAIIDISLIGTNGIELTKSLLSKYPDLLILMVSMHDESIYAERAIKAGAKGYIMKQEASKNVLTAIRKILAGKVYLSNNMQERMLQKIISGQGKVSDNLIDKLSDREFEVFQLIGNGFGTTQIAEKLNLSVKTIETYKDHIKTKLLLKNALELRKFCIKWMQSYKE